MDSQNLELPPPAPSRKRVQHPQKPMPDSNTSIRNFVPSQSYSSECTILSLLINHAKETLLGRKIIGVETGPDKTPLNMTIVLDNDEWVLVEPKWRCLSDGTIEIQGLCITTSIQIRNMRDSQGDSETNSTMRLIGLPIPNASEVDKDETIAKLAVN